MKIPFVTKLVNETLDTCDICHQVKVLKYLVTTPKGNMLSVCERCKDYARSNPEKLDPDTHR